MKIGDLPREQLEEILAVCAEHKLECEGIIHFDVEERSCTSVDANGGRSSHDPRFPPVAAQRYDEHVLVPPILLGCLEIGE